jgi:hypothetical protein
MRASSNINSTCLYKQVVGMWYSIFLLRLGTSDLSKRFNPTLYHRRAYCSLTAYIFTDGAFIGLPLLFSVQTISNSVHDHQGNEWKGVDTLITHAILNTSSKILLAILHTMVALIFTADTDSLKITVFLDVTPCSLIQKHGIFRAVSCLHHPGRRMMT